MLSQHRRPSSATSGVSDASALSGAAAARSSAETATTRATTTNTDLPRQQNQNIDDDDDDDDDGDAPQPPKKRIRAIVACSHCRSKRSKCDGVPGKKPCTQCRQRGIPCEMSDGKRNRGHYKPQAEALMKQVQLLQQALAEAQAEAQAANQALQQQQQQQQQQQHSDEQHQRQHSIHQLPHHLAFDDAHSLMVLPDMDPDHGLLAPQTAESIAASTLAPVLAPPSLSPHLFMDPSLSHVQQHHPNYTHQHHQHRNQAHLSGPVDGPALIAAQHTTASTVAATQAMIPAPAAPLSTTSSPDGSAASASPLADLSPSSPLVDYLLGLYFHRYQMMMKFVSQRDFMQQHHRNPAQSVRSGLFLAMVAAGLRYSTRADVTARFLRRADGENENLLATAARRAVETELGRPTLATVQTILILGEVETSLGHQMTGYMYCCLASKLIFEMGLDPGSCADRLALCQEETTIRHWLVWSASVQEQYWGVFLRRPVTIKNQTLQMSRLAWRFSEGVGVGRGSSGGDGESGSSGVREENGLEQSRFEKEVDEELLDLMELAREVTDELYGHGALAAYREGAWTGPSGMANAEDGGAGGRGNDGGAGGLPQNHYPGGGVVRPYVPDLDRLDARLDDWFGSLSDRIRTGPVSGGRDCYHFLFVLHLTFNLTKIVVHRERAALPFAGAAGPSAAAAAATATSTTPPEADAVAASRRAMGAAAVRIAKLFAIFRRREDIRALKSTGVQWASMAAEALVRYIETLPIDGAVEAVAHLQSLQRTLKDMTASFRSAEDAYAATAHAVATFQRRLDGDEDSPAGGAGRASTRTPTTGGGGGGGHERSRGVDEVDGLEGLGGLEALDGLDRLDDLDGLELEGGAGAGGALPPSSSAAAGLHAVPTATMTFGMDPPPPPSQQHHHHHHQHPRHHAHHRRHHSSHVLHALDGSSLASPSHSVFSASLAALTAATSPHHHPSAPRTPSVATAPQLCRHDPGGGSVGMGPDGPGLSMSGAWSDHWEQGPLGE